MGHTATQQVYYTRKFSAEITHASWGIGRRHNSTDPGHNAAHAHRTRALPSFNQLRCSPRLCQQKQSARTRAGTRHLHRATRSHEGR